MKKEKKFYYLCFNFQREFGFFQFSLVILCFFYVIPWHYSVWIIKWLSPAHIKMIKMLPGPWSYDHSNYTTTTKKGGGRQLLISYWEPNMLRIWSKILNFTSLYCMRISILACCSETRTCNFQLVTDFGSNNKTALASDTPQISKTVLLLRIARTVKLLFNIYWLAIQKLFYIFEVRIFKILINQSIKKFTCQLKLIKVILEPYYPV